MARRALSIQRVPVLASDPASPQDGDIWYNSTLGQYRLGKGGLARGIVFNDDTYVLAGNRKFRATVPMEQATGSITTPPSGMLYIAPFAAYGGDVFNYITAMSSASSGNRMDWSWCALYDDSDNLVAQTNAIAGDWLASTARKFQLQSQVNVASDRIMYAAIYQSYGAGGQPACAPLAARPTHGAGSVLQTQILANYAGAAKIPGRILGLASGLQVAPSSIATATASGSCPFLLLTET